MPQKKKDNENFITFTSFKYRATSFFQSLASKSDPVQI